MSFTDISRNCFQSGISATRWLNLCKTFIAQNPSIHTAEEVAKQISNSVLVLYHSYPAEPRLNSYLKRAIEDGILPLSIYVTAFLEASSSFNSSATLDALCDLAVQVPNDSGQRQFEDSLRTLLNAGHCLKLMQVACTVSPHEKLFGNSSRLLMNLLSCVSDYTQLPIQEAWSQVRSVQTLLNSIPRYSPVWDFLKSWDMTLNVIYVFDSDMTPKTARDAQLATATSDIGGPNSQDDVITLALLFQYLVNMRGHEFGAGHTNHAAALLISSWRSSSWPIQVFYTQALISAFTLPECQYGNPLLWKAFIAGRLPALLATFQAVIGVDQSIDCRGALQHGLRLAFRRPDLIVPADQFFSRIDDGNNSTPSFTHELLQQLVRLNLIDQQFALELDPSLVNQVGSGAYLDTGLMDTGGVDITLNQDLESVDVGWFDRVARDVSVHSIFANLVLKKFSNCSKTLDVEALSSVCRLLYTHAVALDLVALHVRLSEILFHALFFLEQYDCETVGDPQTAVGHLGNVVLFVQYALARFQLEMEFYVKDTTVLSVDFLRRTHEVFSVESFSPAEAASFHSWFKALFDSNSEGIEDSILRSTHPKTLLRISATLFFQAIRAASAKKIDMETLVNGVSYFTGPLLNWTLVGVVEALIRDVQSARDPSPETLEVLQTLLLSPSCPTPVHSLCKTSVLRYLADKGEKIDTCPSFKVTAVRDVVRAANPKTHILTQPARNPTLFADQQLAMVIARAASLKVITDIDVDMHLRMMNPMRFLRLLCEAVFQRIATDPTSTTPPQVISMAETGRRVATYVLTMPMRNVWVPEPSSSSTTTTTATNPTGTTNLASSTSSNPSSATSGQPSRIATNLVCPPLLPLFMHVVLPLQLGQYEKAAAQSVPAAEYIRLVGEFMTSLIVSSLNAALQLEWALASVYAASSSTTSTGPNAMDTSPSGAGAGGTATAEGMGQKPRAPCVLGASSSSIARRLAADLKARKEGSQLVQLILQRLGSSESFVDSFPYFGSNIES